MFLGIFSSSRNLQNNCTPSSGVLGNSGAEGSSGLILGALVNLFGAAGVLFAATKFGVETDAGSCFPFAPDVCFVFWAVGGEGC